MDRLLLALAGFIGGLQIVRLLSLAWWGNAKLSSKTVVFFLGASNGQQLIVHLFYLVALPLWTFLWVAHFQKPLTRASALKRLYVWSMQGIALAPLFIAAWAWSPWLVTAVFKGALLAAAFEFARRRWGSGKAGPLRRLTHSPFTLIIFTAALYLLLFPGLRLPFEIDWYHDADQLGPGMDYFLFGKIPFRDIFIAQGLGHNVFKSALAFKLWGLSAGAKKWMDALTAPLGFVGLAIFLWVVLERKLLWLFGLLTLAVLFLYFPDRQLLACLSLAATALGTCRGDIPKMKRSYWLGLAGVLAAAQFWHSMDVGLFVIATEIVFLGWRREITAYLAGLGIVFAGAGIFLGAQGALGDALRNIVVRCLSHQDIEGIAFHPLRMDLPGVPGAMPGLLRNSVVLWYLPLLVQYGTVTLLFLQRKRWPAQVVKTGSLLTLAAFFFFYSALSHGDFEHLSFSAPYSGVLALWLVERLLDGSRRPVLRHLAAVTLCLVFVLYLNDVFALSDRMRLLPRSRGATIAGRSPSFQTRMEGARLDPEIQDLLRELDHLTDKTVPLLNLTEEGALSFAAGRPNLIRYYLPDYLYTDAMEGEVIDALGQRQNRVIVLTPAQGPGVVSRSGRRLERLDTCIRSNFNPAWSNRRYIVWMKR